MTKRVTTDLTMKQSRKRKSREIDRKLEALEKPLARLAAQVRRLAEMPSAPDAPDAAAQARIYRGTSMIAAAVPTIEDKIQALGDALTSVMRRVDCLEAKSAKPDVVDPSIT